MLTGSGTVRWDRLGDPGAEPVVLPHGTPFSSYVWHEIAPALATVGHHVHVWDRAGYGTSGTHPGQDVSPAAQGRILTELPAHPGLRVPSVAAHDFGGCVAPRARLLHRARYRRIAQADQRCTDEIQPLSAGRARPPDERAARLPHGLNHQDRTKSDAVIASNVCES
ncbi:alpha/beta hydrolase [Streptomyces sp. NPDC126510]|uniref:alpha/beta fold hydrolase n=1 Tax=Streptomyces sp. NPDC126510 TaxID=3155317 RepID=UPI00331FE240